MYYEEKVIDGVMHWRDNPEKQLQPYTLEELSERYTAAKFVLKRVTLLHDECKGDAEYASDQMSLLLIIRDIATAAKNLDKKLKEG